MALSENGELKILTTQVGELSDNPAWNWVTIFSRSQLM